MRMKSLNLIGGGRVGRTLGRLWHASGSYRVQDVLTGSARTAEEAVTFIGAGQAVTALADMRAADVWMLAVPDRQIAAVAATLAHGSGAIRPTLAFHCSGALASRRARSPARRRLASGQRPLRPELCRPGAGTAAVCRHALRAGGRPHGRGRA